MPWQGYLRQSLTVRKDLHVHNVHLCLREINCRQLLTLRKGLVPDKSVARSMRITRIPAEWKHPVGEPAGKDELVVLGFVGACFVLFLPLFGCNLACNSLDTRPR